MNSDDRISIKVKLNTKLRLMRRMKYGDSFDSALNEMLDALDATKLEPLPNEQPTPINGNTNLLEVENGK
jgi:hypothetical protein